MMLGGHLFQEGSPIKSASGLIGNLTCSRQCWSSSQSPQIFFADSLYPSLSFSVPVPLALLEIFCWGYWHSFACRHWEFISKQPLASVGLMQKYGSQLPCLHSKHNLGPWVPLWNQIKAVTLPEIAIFWVASPLSIVSPLPYWFFLGAQPLNKQTNKQKSPLLPT